MKIGFVLQFRPFLQAVHSPPEQILDRINKINGIIPDRLVRFVRTLCQRANASACAKVSADKPARQTLAHLRGS